jgi:hypothetical protein
VAGIVFKLARCGYALRVTSQTSYSPGYITPARRKKTYELYLVSGWYNEHAVWFLLDCGWK